MLHLDVADILDQLKAKNEPKRRIDLLTTLSYKTRRIDAELSLLSCREAYQLSKEIEYEIGLASSLFCLAVHDNAKGEYIKAIEKNMQALDIFETNQIVEDKIKCLNGLGYSYNYLGNSTEAINYFLKGLDLAKEIHDQPMSILFLNNIGDIYQSSLNMSEEALKYFFESEKICRLTNDPFYSFVVGNIADTYCSNGQNDEALKHGIIGLTAAIESKSNINQSFCHFVLGKIYKNLNQFDLMLSHLDQSLEIRQQLNDRYGLSKVYLEYGNYYIEVERYPEAIQNFNKALYLAKEIEADKNLRKIYYLLAQAYEKNQEFEKAAHYYKDYIETNDKIISEDLEKKITSMTLDSKLSQAKKDAEIYRLKNVELKAKTEEIEQKAKELEISHKHIEIISEIGQKITSSLDIEVIMNTIYESTNKLMDATIFGIGLYDAESGIIDYRIFIENHKRIPNFQLDVKERNSFASECILSNQYILSNDLQILDDDVYLPDDDPENKESYPRSLIYYPLEIENKVIGTITVQSYEINAYSENAVETLKTLASYISIAVNNAQKSETLQNTLIELKEAQDYLIQSEKMAALGQLISGIAHEINTPLGVIQASVNNILEYIQETIGVKIPRLFLVMDMPLKVLFFDLLTKAMSKDVMYSSKEERKIKRAIMKNLEVLEIEHAMDIADLLVDMGILEDYSKYLPIFEHEESQLILSAAYEISGVYRNVKNMNIAVSKASKMIYALKSYTHYDYTDSLVKSNIVDGIETILSLYHNNIKQGTEVIKHYDPVDEIECYPDELNQVWTNIIQNALHAMEHKGILEIFVSQNEKEVIVTISDSGSGIPETLKDKIFEPFFTTKRQGEGSGLGMGIVKKIIDKHHGHISVESEPGNTRFTVRIPFEQKHAKNS